MKRNTITNTLQILVTLSVLVISIESHAQSEEPDSKPASRTLPTLDKIPIAEVKYDYLSQSDYTKKMKNQGLYERGTLNSVQHIQTNIIFPIFRHARFTIAGTGEYSYTKTDYKHTENIPVPFHTLDKSATDELNLFRGGVVLSYRTKLLNKPLIVTATGIFDASEKYFENITALGTATMILHQSRSTLFGLGIYASTSRASQIPVVPILTYRHQISGSPYMINIIFPKHTYITRQMGQNGRLSAGFSFENYRGYVYLNQEGFKPKYTYDRIDITLEMKYEHALTKNVIFNASAGGAKCYRGVLREKNKKKDVMQFSQDANFLCKFAIKCVL